MSYVEIQVRETTTGKWQWRARDADGKPTNPVIVDTEEQAIQKASDFLRLANKPVDKWHTVPTVPPVELPDEDDPKVIAYRKWRADQYKPKGLWDKLRWFLR